MDILRLPSALRRSILQHYGSKNVFRRILSTATTGDGLSTPPEQPSNSAALNTSSPATPLKLSPSTLNTYAITTPPDSLQLRQASSFFKRHDTTLLFTAGRFLELPPSPYPEVVVLGRSNVGKSSLLNALFGRPRKPLAHVSKKPGKTQTINGYGVGGDGVAATSKKKSKKGNPQSGDVHPAWKIFGRGGMIVVDMPGYGKGSREEWGKEIMKYIESRKQLRRTYILVDTEHGLKQSDLSLISYLREQGIPYQIVLSKVDKIIFPRTKASSPEKLSDFLLKLEDIKTSIARVLRSTAEEAGMRNDAMMDILCCSGNRDKLMESGGKRRMIGMDELRWSMFTACGMEYTGKLEDLGKKAKAKMEA